MNVAFKCLALERTHVLIKLINDSSSLIPPLVDLCVSYVGKLEGYWYWRCENGYCSRQTKAWIEPRLVQEWEGGWLFYIPYIGCCWARNGRQEGHIPAGKVLETDTFDLNAITDLPQCQSAPVHKYLLPVWLKNPY